VLSATEAGPLHFGYGKESYTYDFDPENGYDATGYFTSRWIWSKPSWQNSPWVARGTNPRIVGGDTIVYDIDDTRTDRSSIKRVGLRF